MKITILSDEERRNCYKRYRENDIFRHWFMLLSKYETETGIDPISVWYNAQLVLRELRSHDDFRDSEMEFIISEAERCNPKHSVVAVMAVTLISLVNAAEEGHEDEYIPNDCISNVILKKYLDNKLFEKLLNGFSSKKTGNDGKKVVLKQSDPLAEDYLFEDVDSLTQKDIKELIKRVIDNTQGLKAYFKDDWEIWENLWQHICLDIELFNLLQVISPKRNDWKFNQKMICNVIGIFINERKIKTAVSAINKCISNKNISSYISNIKDFEGNNSALSKTQYETIKGIINKL